MPFLTALGYDVSDPAQVIPEFNADVGTKKGERVDYAIMIDNAPAMLFECKHHATNLDQLHASQLFRYFNTTSARIGILTNGIVYRFFSDLEMPNRMDSKPFLELNMLDLEPVVIEEAKRFSRDSFDIDVIKTKAKNLKYLRELKQVLNDEFFNPSPDFVRFFANRVAHRRMTQNCLSEFEPLTRKALDQFLDDQMNERQESASPTKISVGRKVRESPHSPHTKIVTTAEERKGLDIVRSLLFGIVEPERITLRDNQTYAAVLLDDNNRKTICRLRFNHGTKYVGFLDAENAEQKVPITDVNELYDFKERMKTAFAAHDTNVLANEQA